MEPPPPEQGILINFGYDDQGSGQEQTKSSVQKPQEVVKEKPVEESVQSRSDQEVLTQDSEDAAKVNSEKSESLKKEEVKEEPKPSEELSKANSKWKNKSDNKSSSDGITGKEGDQGDPNGSLDSKSYTGGSGGNGFKLIGLGGRNMVKPPIIKDISQEEGKVIVDIIVDKNGKVLRANPGARGSTTTSAVLYKIAKEAALSTKFNTNPQAPEQQKGQIVFTFLVKG